MISKKVFYSLFTLSMILGNLFNAQAMENSMPKYLFKISYENHAWGFSYKGTVIDQEGNIYSYSCTQEARKAAGPNPTNDDLLKYCSDGNPRGKVDIKELQEMYQLALTLDPGNFVEGVQAYDAGITMYTAFKAGANGVEPIILHQFGDASGTNSSPHTKKIVDWLETVTDSKKKIPSRITENKVSMPPYLFQVALKDSFIKNKIVGYLIDQDGNIFHYDCGKKRFKPKAGWSDTEENLIKNCSSPKNPTGKVDLKVLNEMYNLSLSLDPNNFVDTTQSLPGLKIKPLSYRIGYIAFRMNGVMKTSIKIRECGKSQGINSSPDARKIADWLVSVTESFGSCRD